MQWQNVGIISNTIDLSKNALYLTAILARTASRSSPSKQKTVPLKHSSAPPANALVEKQRASLVDMHKDACPWRTRQCEGCRRPELYTQHMPKGRGGGRANFGHPKPEGRSNFFKYCSCDFCNQTLDNPAQPHVTFTRPGNSCDPLREFNNYSANVNAMLQNLEITTIDGSQNTPMISETTGPSTVWTVVLVYSAILLMIYLAATPMGSTVTN
ncbi:hypothetical protein F5J12DRAFT_786703 [Pisolithus orientalis]|uniref:uncharacterized protein n=1 Tax=Pisolithus orientalis TaxID=936130 RepID=UPI002224D358|nr:uncharacterized protein F5J12DRAFT_786703 [Pisolithus orientalis]KAI5989195.1 hypothetical protein F5J12DRAFT_786703 [Pisolithus orientalis]